MENVPEDSYQEQIVHSYDHEFMIQHLLHFNLHLVVSLLLIHIM